MFSFETYKLAHLLGVFLLFLSMGGVALRGMTRPAAEVDDARDTDTARGWLAAWHGFALALILIAGFGMLATKHLMAGGVPGWAWGKIVVWVAFGALLPLARRRPDWGRFVFLAAAILGVLAAAFAIYKP